MREAVATTALSRRDALKTSVLLTLAAGASVAAGSSSAAQPAANAKTLVAYFTRTGNTRVIAGQIRRALGADMFEIEPAEPYPEDYQATVSQAEGEREAGYEPPLKATVANIGLVRGDLPRFSDLGNDRAIGRSGPSCPVMISRARPSCRSSRMAATVLGRAFRCLPSMRRGRGSSKVFPSNATRSGKHYSR